MTEVIGVRFRGGCKEYYFDPHGITVEPNQFVIVETAQGQGNGAQNARQLTVLLLKIKKMG